MMRFVTAMMLTILGLAAASPAKAAFVIASTSFEPVAGPGGVPTGSVGGYSGNLGGGFTGSNVDVLAANYSGTNPTGQYVDLSGTAFGSVSVTISTVGGSVYTVDYLAGANNQGGSNPKVATLTAGTASTTISRATSATFASSFLAGSFSFVGTGSPTTITFATATTPPGSAAAFGVLLDNVVVSVATPAPAGAVVLAAAAGLMGLVRRFRVA